MKNRRSALSFGIVFVAGISTGWLLTGGASPKFLLANGGDRWGDRALTSGAITIESAGDDKHPISIPLDALYYINYSTGKLYATVPTILQNVSGAHAQTDFAERDLLADFAIKPGVTPHFLMTTAGLGGRSLGWAPLFVIETETGQIATYKVEVQMKGGTTTQFQLLDRKVDRRLGKLIVDSARQP